MNELIRQIKEMRQAQREYDRTKDRQTLRIARTLEQRVDKMIIEHEAAMSIHG